MYDLNHISLISNDKRPQKYWTKFETAVVVVGKVEAFTYFNGVLRRDSPLGGKFHRAYV